MLGCQQECPYLKAKVGRKPVQLCSSKSSTLFWGEVFPDAIDDVLTLFMLCCSCKRKPYLRI
jgi:hypothetical protein